MRPRSSCALYGSENSFPLCCEVHTYYTQRPSVRAVSGSDRGIKLEEGPFPLLLPIPRCNRSFHRRPSKDTMASAVARRPESQRRERPKRRLLCLSVKWGERGRKRNQKAKAASAETPPRNVKQPRALVFLPPPPLSPPPDSAIQSLPDFPALPLSFPRALPPPPPS